MGRFFISTDRQISWRGALAVWIRAAIRKALERAGFIGAETEIVESGTVYFAVRAFRLPLAPQRSPVPNVGS
jgi:hypothetical protein